MKFSGSMWLLVVVIGAICDLMSNRALGETTPVALIPFPNLSLEAQSRVRRVTSDYTFYRRVCLPHPEVAARIDIFEHLIDHLDQTSLVAQKMGLAKKASRRLDDGSIYGDSGEGTVGRLWPLYAAQGQRLCFVEGSDRHGKPVAGTAVALLVYREQRPGVLVCELHAFIKLDAWYRNLLAPLMPLLEGMLDRRFGEMANVPLQIAEQASNAPENIETLINEMPSDMKLQLADFQALLRGCRNERLAKVCRVEDATPALQHDVGAADQHDSGEKR